MHSHPVIGWREWVALPELGVKRIKAKIDTGARTSALHAFRVDTFNEHGKDKVSFALHPSQYSTKRVINCVTDLIDVRSVTDSGGHREQRYVISTLLQIGNHSQMIEITLTSRDDMRFRFLLGRTALAGNFLINPAASYITTLQSNIS